MPRPRRFAPALDPLERRDLMTTLPPRSSNLGAPGDGVIDVTFISDRFTDMAKYRADVQHCIDDLLSVEPYKSRRSQFAFHVIENAVPLDSVAPGNRMISADFAKVEQVVLASGFTSDVVALIADLPDYGGAGGYPIITISHGAIVQTGAFGEVRVNEARVFSHEFSHAAGLQDEYILYPNDAPPIFYQAYAETYANLALHPQPPSAWADLVAPDEYTRGGMFRNLYRASPISLMNGMGEAPFLNAVSQAIVNASLDLWAAPIADASAPAVALPGLASGSEVAGVVVLDPAVSDDLGVTRVQLWVDGKLERTAYRAPFRLYWNTADDAPGAHRVEVRAFDAAGNMGRSPEVLVTLARGSNFDLIAPADGASVSADFDVQAIAWPDPLLMVTATLGGLPLPLRAGGPSPFTFFAGLAGRAPGAQALVVTAFDSRMNVVYRAARTVVIADEKRIGVELQGVSAAAPARGKVTLSARVLHGDVASVRFFVDGKPRKLVTSAPFAYRLNTKALRDGRHRVAIVATGASGEAVRAEVAFRVKNKGGRKRG